MPKSTMQRSISTKLTVPENSFHACTRADWRSWLEENQTRKQGVWLITHTKAAGKPMLEYDDMVEEALCYGWIDATGKNIDGNRHMRWLSPRKPKSGWSRINKARIAKMMLTEGLMAEAGLSKIEEAKRDGSWTLLDGPEALSVPKDLQKEFQGHQKAKTNFDAFPPSARKAILTWIVQAKTPATRAKRISETVRLADKNIRANQWPRVAQKQKEEESQEEAATSSSPPARKRKRVAN